ncbi:alpha/beta hydrolase family protein [Chitinophaga nivalis]|uniref:Alpha/beta fold hydrolase n=1 Tax=Chitinophaga nivalis TaxID=2991709 RepID=A0ABT3IKB8_9BACT|nr:alpha/beta fold hydrolase [Chitinophaga nivalis]MCW3466100.1 alpha/beta fold hydrolase [Chitinophaga nivalis]MCW3484209.1 alpha/beta fold hydrolase [Chitinophaga nivalis]
MENITVNTRSKKSWYPLGLFNDPVLENVFLFYLESTWQKSADAGECYETAARIDESNVYSWSDEWTKTANRLHALGDTCLAEQHKLTAGEAYLRAATYYRAALHRHPDSTTNNIKQLSLKVLKDFNKALTLLSYPFQAVSIPYQGTSLPGYFFRAAVKPHKKAPVIIFHSGRDAWAEDNLWIAEYALKRGYHCLLMDGPGQGKVIRLQGLPFRPDWENVITPVVDFLEQDCEVDMKRSVLMGFSMGGFLAPRAMTTEKRIKLCVANPGVLSWEEGVFDSLNRLIPDLMLIFQAGDYDLFDTKMAALMQTDPFIKWGITDEMWKNGASKPSELLRNFKAYTSAHLVKNITCRTLVVDGTGEEFSRGQAKKLYDALTCPKDFILFTEEDTGYLHCQTGALAISYTRIFNWIDKHIH